MAISEIEKLERRYSENPHGYTFAPLAEAYRKSADLPRALDVLKRGLELHPDYVPASIVLGRVHLDKRDDSSAELAFSHVLTLDPENVIALKAMADITERANRPADAARWLELLLAVDRSNEEARQQLDRLAASRPSWPEPTPSPAVVEEQAEGSVGTLEQAFEAATGTSGTTAVGAGEIASDEPPPPEPEPQEHLEGVLPAAPYSAGPPPMDDVLTLEPSPMQGLEVSERSLSTPEPAEASAPVEGFESPLAAYADEGLASTPESHAPDLTFDRPPSHAEYQLPDMSQDFGMELRSSGANEFQLPSASDEFSSLKPANTHNEYQLPDASGEFGVTGADKSASAPPPPPAPEPPPAPRVEEATPPPVEAAASSEPTPAIEPLSPLTWQHSSWSQPEPVEPPPPPAEPATPAPFSWSPSSSQRSSEPEPPPEPKKPWYETAFETPEPAPTPEPIVSEQATTPEPEPLREEPVAEEPVAAFAAEPEPASIEPDASEEAEPVFAAEPELVVTESMAELFLQQGHKVEALRVYRELVQRRPGDERLVAKVMELEIAEEVVTPVSPPVARPSFAAETTGGTSVRELLRAILVSRPVSGEAAEAAAEKAAASKAEDASGAPTRPAPDHLSLSAIFGDDSPANPPAVRPTKPAATKGSGMSFDEFYGGGADASGDEPTGKSQRSIRGGDDLDQFHNWLQNLKR